jgi:hypothetical protein
VRVQAEGSLLPGRGELRKLAAGEAVSAADGSFEIALSAEFLAGARSRNFWHWELELHAEHPDAFRPSVTPSRLDSWEKIAEVTVAFADYSAADLAALKAKLEALRRNPARSKARYGLEPTHWGELQELFDECSNAAGESRAARRMLQDFEKDPDPSLRALAYEALGLHNACEDDARRPPQPTNAVSARALLEWCYRDVERSKHGGHYSRAVKLDDGCTRCYTRWEDADLALRMLHAEEAKVFLAEHAQLKEQVAVFHALLAEDFRPGSRPAVVSPELRPDFELSMKLAPGDSTLVSTSFQKPSFVGPRPLDRPLSFVPEGFQLDEFAWSPDGKRLAGRGGYDLGPTNDLWILDVEKGQASRATWGNVIDWRPQWFPDGKRLLFARNGAQGQSLWILDAATFESRKMDSSDLYLDHYSIHPDGKRVAVGPRGAAPYVLDLDSSRKSPATTGDGSDRMPSWSPDGTKIAFLRQGALHVMETGGSAARRLSPEGLDLNAFSWSPDGKRFCFPFQRSEHESGLGVLLADGSGFRELRGWKGWPGFDRPAWARDSRHVAYGGEESGGFPGELWIHPIQGGTPYRLVEGSAARAAWRPRQE